MNSLPVRSERAAAYGWEDRSYLNDHPSAPRDLIQAFVGKAHSVQVFEHESMHGVVWQLLFRRHDGGSQFGWTELQRMKNELVGEDAVAIEIFPAESEVVDQANCRHLWVLAPGVIDFGLSTKKRSETA